MTKSKIVFEELEELYGQFHIFGQEWVDSADVKAVTKARHRAKLVIKAMKSFVETTISEESRLLAEEVQRLEEEISEETEEQNEQDEHEHDHEHDHGSSSTHAAGHVHGPDCPPDCGHDHDHDHEHEHASPKHDDRVTSVSLIIDGDLDLDKVGQAGQGYEQGGSGGAGV